jgi:hypothetical protein
LPPIDDFDGEIESAGQNRELLEFLEQRFQEEKTLTLSQVRERLKLA